MLLIVYIYSISLKFRIFRKFGGGGGICSAYSPRGPTWWAGVRKTNWQFCTYRGAKAASEWHTVNKLGGETDQKVFISLY
jgi:hypothetical protein